MQEARERRRGTLGLASLSQIREFARRLLTYDYSSFLLSSSAAEHSSSLENFHQQEEGPKNRGKQNKKIKLAFNFWYPALQNLIKKNINQIETTLQAF